MKTILILASNPKGTSVLDLDREIRDIREGLRRSQNRDQFYIELRGAVRPVDLRRSLLEVKPQIVHFCGHGDGEDGLVLENDDGKAQLVKSDELARLFEIFADQVECILLDLLPTMQLIQRSPPNPTGDVSDALFQVKWANQSSGG